ncbi:MAG: hypothetical protein IT440_16195, partial [Phycisphaeraceae bacterium]|nr:hypothetical protein [Phycisphaeraceae bacterium]
MGQVKNEIEQQLIAAKVIGNDHSVRSSTSSPQSLNFVDPIYDEGDDERDDDDSLDIQTFLDDFYANSNECAFPSKSSNQCLTNQRVYQLIRNQSDFIQISKSIEEQLHKPNEHMCTSIDLNRHYEVYFESSDSTSTNLLTFEHLQSLCKKQSELVELFQLHSTCHFTLPQLVAFFAEKSDCRQLTPEDIPNFIERIQRCHALYDVGVIRLVGLHRYQKSPLELFQYDSCFRYNFTFLALEYLLDKSFLETNQTKYTGMWFLKPTLSMTN